MASKHTHQSTRIKTHTHWHAHLHGIPGQVQVRRQPVSTRTLPAVARARSEGTKLTRSTRSKLPSSLLSKCPIPIQVKPCPRCGCGLGCGCGCGLGFGCGCDSGCGCGCCCGCSCTAPERKIRVVVMGQLQSLSIQAGRLVWSKCIAS